MVLNQENVKKHLTKRNLRNIKKSGNLFQQIDIDRKNAIENAFFTENNIFFSILFNKFL